VRRSANPRGAGSRLRDELLDAATRLLEAGGRDAMLTLRGVAREAGVAAPSVYPHFADLDALVIELIRRQLADLTTAVRTAVASAGTPVEALMKAARAYVRWGLERPGPYTVVFEGRALRQLTPNEELGLSAGEDLLADLVDLLRALPRPPADAATAAVGLWSGLHGVVALRTAKPAYPWPPLEAHVNAVVGPFVRTSGLFPDQR
jgi:AcrR family transcriptional regulator